ncbi:MAG: class A beta-lactamase-related serine hydrolase [Pyrinomonadaceae bacterium]|nr:class A beta-lactamase-related serine hydrolase [Pyrinomonadaceae bacterium]
MFKKIIVVAILLIVSQGVFAQRVKPTPKPIVSPPTLDEKIKAEIGNFSGRVWIYAKNLDTGRDYGLRGEEQVRTASTIKLPIMTEVFHQIAEGKIKWTDEFTLTKANKQAGSGTLGELSDGSKIDLKSATNLMIVVSDNTATNLILDKISSNSVNAFMESLGIKNTKSLRKIGGGGDAKAYDEPLNKLFGIGVSTPKDMATLLEKLERGEVLSREASAEMIAILKRQQYTDGLARNTLDTVPAASKSGALDRLRSDVGIIYTRRGRIVMAITVDDMPVVSYGMDNAGNELIWRLSQILQDGLGR